jgi:hypothetical protein
MMPSRSLLHKTKLGELKEWLTANHVKWREVDHEWQEIQIRVKQRTGFFGWSPIFSNLGSDHFSVPDNLIGLVATFIRDSKNGN